MAITWECSRGDSGYLYASVYCVDAIKYWSGSKTNAGDTTRTSGEKGGGYVILLLYKQIREHFTYSVFICPVCQILHTGLKIKVNSKNILSRPATMISQDSLTNHFYHTKLGVWKLLKATVI